MRFMDFEDATDSPERRALIEENQKLHAEARRHAMADQVYVICNGLIYGPSGQAIASAFTYEAGQQESLERLVALANERRD